MVEENEKSEKGKDLSKFDWTESQINAQTYKWQFYSKKHDSGYNVHDKIFKTNISKKKFILSNKDLNLPFFNEKI